jgi:hypothetical protein
MRIRITTALERDAVLNSLRDLVTASDSFVGVVNHNHVSVTYRSMLDPMPPRMRPAVFLGRVVSAPTGAVIEGEVETHWFGWAGTAMLLLVTIAALGRELLAGNFMALGMGVLMGTAVLFGWWKYVQRAKQLIVAEICRASRGSVA